MITFAYKNVLAPITAMNEEQFVLRLPPELAARLRRSISKKKTSQDEQSTFTYTINEDRTGLFTCDGTEYPAKLMDLPCIVESHKTADKRTFYKSADVHQVLVVRNPGEPAPEGECLPDGLTNGAKGARERVKVADGAFSADEVTKVEKRIKMVLDKKVQFVRKKKTNDESDVEEEIIIEEEGVRKKDQVSPPKQAPQISKISAAPVSGVLPPRPSSAVPATGPAQISKAAPSSLPMAKAASPSPAPVSSPVTIPPTVSEPMIGAPSPPAASPPPPAASPAMSPKPEASAAEDEEEDEEDLSAWAEDMLEQDKEEEGAAFEEDEHAKALKRIERANLEKKIEEQRKSLAQQTQLAENMPNPIMKQRLLGKRDELQAELTALEEELAKI